MLFLSEFKVWPTAITIELGSSSKININQVATFTSENPEIATVDTSGQVHPKIAGDTVILVKSHKGQTKTVKVRVIGSVTATPQTNTPEQPHRIYIYPCVAGAGHSIEFTTRFKTIDGMLTPYCTKCGCVLN